MRVPIGELSLGKSSRSVAAPEVSLNAARVFGLNNQSGQALLPGKVTLYLGTDLWVPPAWTSSDRVRLSPSMRGWRTK